MAASPIRVGEVLADKYRVEEILGQGGMGIVVAAWHLELEQRVAVKFLLPEYAENKEAAERFRREARAAVKIQSEHVARVVDVGTMPGGIPYMVMEFLSGHDLASELERSGKFAIDAAVDCVFQTCLAMAEAHSRGIIHRDLKPANLFLTSRADGSRLVKVLDFGISKSIQSDSMPQMALTRTSIMVGSPLYMSPEQLESSKQADERSDIWSLGVILFELLTGTLPFTGETLPQLVRSVLTGKYPRVRDLRADVPERLSHVIDRCLESDKSKRIRNVADLADALAPFQSDGYRYSERIRKVLTISSAAKMDSKTRVTGGIPAQTRSMPDEDLPGASGSHTDRSLTDGPLTDGPLTDVSSAEPAPSTGIPVYEDSERPPAPASTNTANSWGRTGARTPSARPGTRAWPWVAAALGVVTIGGLLAWNRVAWNRVAWDGGLAADTTADELAGAVETPSTAATPAAAPPIRITPSEDVLGRTTLQADLHASAEAPLAASTGSSAANSEVVPGVALVDGVKPAAPQGPAEVAGPVGKKPSGKKPSAQPAPKPATAPSTNKPDYTDFGGRR